MDNNNNKESIKEKLQQATKELELLTKIPEPISTNWNDDIAKAFNEKYKNIEKNIQKLIKEIEELEKML